jgi:hypothetical protein
MYMHTFVAGNRHANVKQLGIITNSPIRVKKEHGAPPYRRDRCIYDCLVPAIP